MTTPHNTVLNSSAQRGHPCLFSNLRGKASSLAPLGVMLTLDSVYVTYYIIKDGNFPVFLVCWVFLSWKWLNFVKCFFCTDWDDHVIFVFQFVNVIMYYIDWFLYVEPSLHAMYKPHFSWCIILFNMLNLVWPHFLLDDCIIILQGYWFVIFLSLVSGQWGPHRSLL